MKQDTNLQGKLVYRVNLVKVIKNEVQKWGSGSCGSIKLSSFINLLTGHLGLRYLKNYAYASVNKDTNIMIYYLQHLSYVQMNFENIHKINKYEVPFIYDMKLQIFW